MKLLKVCWWMFFSQFKDFKKENYFPAVLFVTLLHVYTKFNFFNKLVFSKLNPSGGNRQRRFGMKVIVVCIQ